MNIIEAIFLGIIQGITEWLPISSSGHLVIVQELFGISANLTYDVLLHFSTLLVIITVFWKDIILMLKNLFSKKDNIALYIIIASIPIGLVGFFLRNQIESLFSSLLVVGIALIFTGTLLFFSERKVENKKLNLKNTFLIGLMQAIAIIPGISRSGTTISTGLLLGIKKETAAKFSFILAIPAILGATILELPKVNLQETPIATIIIGMITSFIIGYISLKFLLKLISDKKFHYFSYYCWIVGLIIIVISIL